MTADKIERLRAENERLAAENEHWRERDDAIRAEFGGKRDGRATIDCLREAFAAKWSKEDALFQATLDMKTEELRAENERLRVAIEDTLNKPRDVNKTYTELFVEVCCELRAAMEENKND